MSNYKNKESKSKIQEQPLTELKDLFTEKFAGVAANHIQGISEKARELKNKIFQQSLLNKDDIGNVVTNTKSSKSKYLTSDKINSTSNLRSAKNSISQNLLA